MNAAFTNEHIHKKYAGIGRRIVAYSIDCALLLFGVAVLQIILFKINPLIAIMRSGRQPTPTQVQLWVFLTATTPLVIYFALFVWSSRRATIGTRLLRLQIEDANGGIVGLGQAFHRDVCTFRAKPCCHVPSRPARRPPFSAVLYWDHSRLGSNRDLHRVDPVDEATTKPA